MPGTIRRLSVVYDTIRRLNIAPGAIRRLSIVPGAIRRLKIVLGAIEKEMSVVAINLSVFIIAWVAMLINFFGKNNTNE